MSGNLREAGMINGIQPNIADFTMASRSALCIFYQKRYNIRIGSAAHFCKIGFFVVLGYFSMYSGSSSDDCLKVYQRAIVYLEKWFDFSNSPYHVFKCLGHGNVDQAVSTVAG